MNLDKTAKDISKLDFSSVDPDNTDEAIYLLATDIYNASEDEAKEIINIIMEKYLDNLE